MARRFMAAVSFWFSNWPRYNSEEVVKELTRTSVGMDGS